jgi:hypothetical protein
MLSVVLAPVERDRRRDRVHTVVSVGLTGMGDARSELAGRRFALLAR